MRAFAFALFLCLPSLEAELSAGETFSTIVEYAPKGATPQYNPYCEARIDWCTDFLRLPRRRLHQETEYAPEGAMRSTIHIRSGESLSALAKRFSTIPTPGNVSMLLREPCRSTIHIRSSGSLLAGSCP